MVYKWKEDSPLAKKADPQAIAREILTIGGASVRPKDLVQEAYLKKNSELHKCFEWDNTVAAIEYRKSQAKEILFSLVKVESTKHGPQEVLAFVDNPQVIEAPVKVRIEVRGETNAGRAETKKPFPGPQPFPRETVSAKPETMRPYDDPVPAVSDARESEGDQVPQGIRELIGKLEVIQDELMAYTAVEDLGAKLGELIGELKGRISNGAIAAVA